MVSCKYFSRLSKTGTGNYQILLIAEEDKQQYYNFTTEQSGEIKFQELNKPKKVTVCRSKQKDHNVGKI